MPPDAKITGLLMVLSACGLPNREAVDVQAVAVSKAKPVCQSEAVRIEQPVGLLAEPDGHAKLLAALTPGSFVYLCETRGGFVGVRFPGPGQPVDCSYRVAGNECPVGWAAERPRTGIVG